MKNAIQLFTMALMVLFIFGCSGPKDFSKTHPSDGTFEEIDDPFAGLLEAANGIIAEGGIAAVGEGISTRQDLAKEKARNEGLGKLAEILEQKIQRLTKAFVEEIGSGNNPQISETFSKVQKNVANAKLSGAIVKDSKLTKNSKTGQFMAGALVVIDPKTINTSILDELKKTDDKLYQQFRSTKGFEELEKEIQKK